MIKGAVVLTISLREIAPEATFLMSKNNNPKRRLLEQTELSQIQQGIERFSAQVVKQRCNSRLHGKAHLADLSGLIYPHWFIPFTHIAMHTGMRPGDIYELLWENIDFKNQFIQFIPKKTQHHASPVEVCLPLTEGLQQVLLAWKKQNSNSHSSDFVFTNPKTNNRFSRTAHKKPWNRIKQLAELNMDIDFYSLRHHFISHLVKAGLPLFTIAKLVGHKSTKMIENHYGHLCHQEAQTALEMIEMSLTLNKQIR